MRRAICITGLFAFLAGSATAATQTVNVGPGISFSPPLTTVNIGDTVTWNFVSAFHSTTSDSISGPETWDSGVVVSAGTMFSHTFTNSGTYPYYCSVHSFPGGTTMNGVVIVRATATAATHFAVSAPISATANSPFTFSVTALDGGNATVTGYSGTVHFTSTDVIATLPVNSTLINGAGAFTAALRTAGNQTLTATDTVSSTVTGTSNPVAVSAGVPTHFAVSAPATASPGSAFSFTVTAQDAFNNTASSYTGTVHFSTTDPGATVPANATLTAGAGTFPATLRTSGTQTLTAADTVSSAIAGSASVSVTAAIPTLSSRALLALAAFIAAVAIAAIRGSRGV